MTTTQGLSAERVASIFQKCLFKEGEDVSTQVTVEGIVTNAGFNPERLQENAASIQEMLRELPEAFMESGGGGMSFLNACQDRNGNQWTGMHQTMEQLFLLGLAIDKVQCLLPREVWSVLPGGMPYYVVKGE